MPSSSAIRSATLRAAIRRGWVWPISFRPAPAAAELEADLGQLGGLARAGLAGDDHDLVVADRLGDVVAARRETGSSGGEGDLHNPTILAVRRQRVALCVGTVATRITELGRLGLGRRRRTAASSSPDVVGRRAPDR